MRRAERTLCGVMFKKLRDDANKTLYVVSESADSLRVAGMSISRTSALVTTVAVAALAIAVVALLTVYNRKAAE